MRSIGICGLIDAAPSAFAPLTRGSISRLSGRPIRICASAQAKQVLRQPICLQPQRGQRPADRAGKTRDQRDAGDRAARLVAIDAPQRGEGGVVQAKSHADAEQQPGDDQDRNGIACSRAGPAPRPASDWKPTAPACRRPDRSGGRRAGRAVPRSPAKRRRRQRSSSWRRRGRARSDRPGSPADSNSMPTPASESCQAPE